MVSTLVSEPEAGHAAGYRGRSQETSTQSSSNASESQNDAYSTAQLSQTLPSQAAEYLPEIPPANGLENSADIWAYSVNSDLRRQNPPMQPISAQGTGQMDPSSLNDQARDEMSTSGIQLQSNNPFLTAKLSRDREYSQLHQLDTNAYLSQQ